jgi:hypothetical protein
VTAEVLSLAGLGTADELGAVVGVDAFDEFGAVVEVDEFGICEALGTVVAP